MNKLVIFQWWNDLTNKYLFVGSRPNLFFRKDKILERRWTKCIELKGVCVEKENDFFCQKSVFIQKVTALLTRRRNSGQFLVFQSYPLILYLLVTQFSSQNRSASRHNTVIINVLIACVDLVFSNNFSTLNLFISDLKQTNSLIKI